MRSPSLSSVLFLNSTTPLPRAHARNDVRSIALCIHRSPRAGSDSRDHSTSEASRRTGDAGRCPRRERTAGSGTDCILRPAGRDHAEADMALVAAMLRVESSTYGADGFSDQQETTAGGKHCRPSIPRAIPCLRTGEGTHMQPARLSTRQNPRLERANGGSASPSSVTRRSRTPSTHRDHKAPTCTNGIALDHVDVRRRF